MFEQQDLAVDATVVFLARHGETLFNLERRFQGQQDSPLSERGHEQARRLGQRLAGEPLTAVYASDLGRALRTAEYVAAPHGLAVRSDAGLREIDTGEWTGLARDDVRQVPGWAESLLVYRQRPAEHRMPGGESVADVQRRALVSLERIAASHPGQAIAVVSHHVTVETIIAHVLGLDLDKLWLPMRGGNCFISLFELSGGRYTPKIVYDGAHIGPELVGLDGTKGEPEKGAG